MATSTAHLKDLSADQLSIVAELIGDKGPGSVLAAIALIMGDRADNDDWNDKRLGRKWGAQSIKVGRLAARIGV